MVTDINLVYIYIKMQAHPQNILLPSPFISFSCFISHCDVIFLDNSPDVTAEEASVLAKVLRNKRVQNKNEVEVQRNDPSSPLHSVKSFEELPL